MPICRKHDLVNLVADLCRVILRSIVHYRSKCVSQAWRSGTAAARAAAALSKTRDVSAMSSLPSILGIVPHYKGNVTSCS
jgi:hypothetical protein